MTKQTQKPRGFAAMDVEKQREIARKGGKASHIGQHSEMHIEHHGKQGFASMDPEKQREIARKGGKASHKNK